MKTLKVLLVAAVCGLVTSRPTEILNYDAETHSRTESGDPGVAVKGEYRFLNDGKEYKVVYVADDDGFRAQGDHIPSTGELGASRIEGSKSSVLKVATTKRPASQILSAPVEILRYTADDHSRVETGQPGVAVQGEYTYKEGGKEFKVSYVADDQGFRTQNPQPSASNNFQAQPSKAQSNTLQKTASVQSEILNYDAETHSRFETGQPGVAVQGDYKYSNDGEEFKVSYIADDEGFRATGDHIPLAPSTSQSKEVSSSETKTSAEPLQKTVVVPGEILNYDAETHSRVETGVPGVAVKGEYKFVNDGKEYHVMYVADEDGFRPQGTHIANLPEFSSKTSNAAEHETPTETLEKTAPSSEVILSYDAETHSRLETGEPGVAVQGEYKYTNDGKDYKVTYIADDEGFRAEGDHIPLAPQLVKTSQKSESQAPVVSTAKTSASSGEILNYDAETHSRLETGEPGVAVKGEYKFVNDGKEYKITYVADDQGFRAEGDIVPSSIATTNHEKLSPVTADDKPAAVPSVAVEDEKLNQKAEPEQPLKEMSSDPNSIMVVADSATTTQAKTGADCDTPAKAAPVQPTFFIPVHLPYTHPFGYYIVHVKK